MDIALTTNIRDAALEFRQLQRFRDGSGFSAMVVIHSGPFAAAIPFGFEERRLAEFLDDLGRLNEMLSGSAELKATWEPGSIRFEGNGRGQIRVHGELVDTSPRSQRLDFSFNTDQTCLGPLLEAFKQCLKLDCS